MYVKIYIPVHVLVNEVYFVDLLVELHQTDPSEYRLT